MIKKITLAGFILISLIIAINIIKQISQTSKSSERLSQMLDEVQGLEIKNKDLKKQLERIKSSEFVETEARNKLGFAKAGETVMIITEDKIKQILGASASAQIRLSNPLGWWRLFWH